MKDRIVEFPNRYKLVPVPGTTDQYDFVPMPGTVTEEGTPFNKVNLLDDETANFLNMTQINPTVKDALRKLGEKPIYTDDLRMYFMGGIIVESQFNAFE